MTILAITYSILAITITVIGITMWILFVKKMMREQDKKDAKGEEQEN